jgi:hypothetical protein
VVGAKQGPRLHKVSAQGVLQVTTTGRAATMNHDMQLVLLGVVLGACMFLIFGDQ